MASSLAVMAPQMESAKTRPVTFSPMSNPRMQPLETIFRMS